MLFTNTLQPYQNTFPKISKYLLYVSHLTHCCSSEQYFPNVRSSWYALEYTGDPGREGAAERMEIVPILMEVRVMRSPLFLRPKGSSVKYKYATNQL